MNVTRISQLLNIGGCVRSRKLFGILLLVCEIYGGWNAIIVIRTIELLLSLVLNVRLHKNLLLHGQLLL